MSYQLFTELSPEQQEIVSGGGGNSIADLISTNFSQSLQQLYFDVKSTPGGSAVSQVFENQQIDTSAKKVFAFGDIPKDLFGYKKSSEKKH